MSKTAIEVLEQGMKYVLSPRRKALEQYHWRRFGALIVNFLLNVNVLHLVFSSVLIVDFEHVMPLGIVKNFFNVIKWNY